MDHHASYYALLRLLFVFLVLVAAQLLRLRLVDVLEVDVLAFQIVVWLANVHSESLQFNAFKLFFLK